MKSIKQIVKSGAVLLALPLFLTSCDELIGELDNLAPSPVVPTPEPTPAKTYRVYTSGTAYTDEPIPAGATAVESLAADVTWSAGTYVVSSDVSIGGDITLDGNVNLILCDGAELTVKGRIVGGDKSLNIYGQTAGTGKLTMDGCGGDYNIYVKDLQIHGGDISGTNSDQALFTNGTLKIYHGNISATAGSYGLVANGNLSIYGGTITASSTAADAVFVKNASMEMTGGSLTATATALGAVGVKVDNGIDIFGGTIEATADGSNGTGIESNINYYGGAIVATGGPSGGRGISGKLSNKLEDGVTIQIKYDGDPSWTSGSMAEGTSVVFGDASPRYVKVNM